MFKSDGKSRVGFYVSGFWKRQYVVRYVDKCWLYNCPGAQGELFFNGRHSPLCFLKAYMLLEQTNESLWVTSSSTAEAESLSASLVRQGKALKTVSTEMHRPQRGMSHGCGRLQFTSVYFLVTFLSLGESHTHVVYWCPIVLRGTPPPHWWSGDNGSPDEDKKQVTWSFNCSSVLSNAVLDVVVAYH